MDFADDLAMLPSIHQQMKEKRTKLAATSTQVGLNIHKVKSKILRAIKFIHPHIRVALLTNKVEQMQTSKQELAKSEHHSSN